METGLYWGFRYSCLGVGLLAGWKRQWKLPCSVGLREFCDLGLTWESWVAISRINIRMTVAMT